MMNRPVAGPVGAVPVPLLDEMEFPRMTSNADNRAPVDQQGQVPSGTEAAIAALSRQFEAMLPALVGAITADITALAAADAGHDAILARLRAQVHDLKGQGTSFGYPLVTEFGQSLSHLLAEVATPDAATLSRIVLHGDLLTAVAAHRLSGDGGEAGLALRHGLARAMA